MDIVIQPDLFLSGFYDTIMIYWKLYNMKGVSL